MKDTVFVSVAVDDQRYIDQQTRLKESILAIHPDANFLFFTNEYPVGAKSYFDSMYGFKPHAIAEAKKKYSKVFWMDTAMVLQKPVTQLFDDEMIAAIDDNGLYKTISDSCLKYYGLTREQLKEELKWNLVGGSFYFFDFNTPLANKIFDQWMEAEKVGLFGSQYQEASEQLQGHRHDETCLAVAIYMNGHHPYHHHEVGYNIGEEGIMVKRHFK
jgi:hypothetical protein